MNERLRKDALHLLKRGIGAVDPESLVYDYLEQTEVAPTPKARLHLVAVGKAAGRMAKGAIHALGHRLVHGIVILPQEQEIEVPSNWEVYRGGHPLPNEEGLRGAQQLLKYLEQLGAEDVVLCLISGGASALMTLPAEGLALSEVRTLHQVLLRAGATIEELNTVRKHTDQLKGGRLVGVAAPAQVVALVLSDVVGDALDVIASGPTVPDPTTFSECRALLERLPLEAPLPQAVLRHLELGQQGEREESPDASHPCFALREGTQQTKSIVIGSNGLACRAMSRAAIELGYRPLVLTTCATGEAGELGNFLAAIAHEVVHFGQPEAPPCCLIVAGETTVTVTGSGLGGRNQEVALGAVHGLDGLQNVLIASCGSDGIDGPTDAAGAWVDGESLQRAQCSNLSPEAFAKDNNSYRFFEALGDLIHLGPTGTNVMDLQCVLIGSYPSLKEPDTDETQPSLSRLSRNR